MIETNKRDGGEVEQIVQLLVETTPDEPTCLLAAAMLRAQQRALAESRAECDDYANACQHSADDLRARDAEIASLQVRAERLAGALRDVSRYLDPRQFPDAIRKIDAALEQEPQE